jgi:dGTPase
LLEQHEEAFLAPYAQRSGTSLGRHYPEPLHPHRTEFQRDRERVVHCPSFRRLEYKTQVFLNGTGDHYRTRLTHSIEVASICRSIARTLRLNEDLAEAISLAHDLGHPPFGHSGEATLNELMADHGGFDHNKQSVRVVELLEQRYPDFPGLNLTFEVLEGLRKHEPPSSGSNRKSPSLEAQLADLADDLTYCAHDVDDGLQAGLITEEELNQLQLWRDAKSAAKERYPGLHPDQVETTVLRTLIDLQIERLIEDCCRQLESRGIRTVSDVHAQLYNEPVIRFAPQHARQLADLRSFLYENLYFSHQVASANNRAVTQIRDLFHFYLDHPQAMGRQARQAIQHRGIHRAACDYIAGMTDRYITLECQKRLHTD